MKAASRVIQSEGKQRTADDRHEEGKNAVVYGILRKEKDLRP